ncbi:MAG TPA: hypothetical protein VMV68_00545 [Spirochaetia bacterium]|nr:hypothetical protein [Spirochaetia bacterium]
MTLYELELFARVRQRELLEEAARARLLHEARTEAARKRRASFTPAGRGVLRFVRDLAAVFWPRLGESRRDTVVRRGDTA